MLSCIFQHVMQVTHLCIGIQKYEILHRGTKGILLFFFKRPERYNQEVLSHSFICLPLPCVEGIVLICNIDLYCLTGIFNGTGDIFKR